MSEWSPRAAPTLDDFEGLARAAWAELPTRFTRLAGDIVFRVEDFADEETLAGLGIEDPFELTGLYVGVDLTRQSVSDPLPDIPMVFLFRRPILDEWADRADVALGNLVAHVLIHEIGHHFGLTDEQMDALLDSPD